MKKRLIIFIRVVSLLLFQLHGFGQSQNAGSCHGTLSSTVSEDEAINRITLFINRKKEIIKNKNISAQEITISRAGLLGILGTLRNKGYDGLRFYFAINNKVKGSVALKDSAKFSLVIVPTISSGEKDEDGKVISDDDEKNAFVELNGKFVMANLYANPKYVKRMTKYVKTIVPKMEYAFSAENLKETHSLWFSDVVLFKDDGRKGDLYDYVHDCANIKEMKIHFASWTEHPADPADLPYKFQMDLIFEIIYKPSQGNNPSTYFTLAQAQAKKYLEAIYPDLKRYPNLNEYINFLQNQVAKAGRPKQGQLIDLIRYFTTYADTGIPCPPAKCP